MPLSIPSWRTWFPACAWYLLILALTLPPSIGPELPRFPHFDKVAHFCAFGGMAFWIWFGTAPCQIGKDLLRPAPGKRLSAASRIILITAVLGALDEFLQLFAPGRSCEFFDWVADVLGSVAVMTFLSLLPAARTQKEVP